MPPNPFSGKAQKEHTARETDQYKIHQASYRNVCSQLPRRTDGSLNPRAGSAERYKELDSFSAGKGVFQWLQGAAVQHPNLRKFTAQKKERKGNFHKGHGAGRYGRGRPGRKEK